jgi:hypothetical protein
MNPTNDTIRVDGVGFRLVGMTETVQNEGRARALEFIDRKKKERALHRTQYGDFLSVDEIASLQSKWEKRSNELRDAYVKACKASSELLPPSFISNSIPVEPPNHPTRSDIIERYVRYIGKEHVDWILGQVLDRLNAKQNSAGLLLDVPVTLEAIKEDFRSTVASKISGSDTATDREIRCSPFIGGVASAWFEECRPTFDKSETFKKNVTACELWARGMDSLPVTVEIIPTQRDVEKHIIRILSAETLLMRIHGTDEGGTEDNYLAHLNHAVDFITEPTRDDEEKFVPESSRSIATAPPSVFKNDSTRLSEHFRRSLANAQQSQRLADGWKRLKRTALMWGAMGSQPHFINRLLNDMESFLKVCLRMGFVHIPADVPESQPTDGDMDIVLRCTASFIVWKTSGIHLFGFVPPLWRAPDDTNATGTKEALERFFQWHYAEDLAHTRTENSNTAKGARAIPLNIVRLSQNPAEEGFLSTLVYRYIEFAVEEAIDLEKMCAECMKRILPTTKPVGFYLPLGGETAHVDVFDHSLNLVDRVGRGDPTQLREASDFLCSKPKWSVYALEKNRWNTNEQTLAAANLPNRERGLSYAMYASMPRTVTLKANLQTIPEDATIPKSVSAGFEWFLASEDPVTEPQVISSEEGVWKSKHNIEYGGEKHRSTVDLYSCKLTIKNGNQVVGTTTSPQCVVSYLKKCKRCGTAYRHAGAHDECTWHDLPPQKLVEDASLCNNPDAFTLVRVVKRWNNAMNRYVYLEMVAHPLKNMGSYLLDLIHVTWPWKFSPVIEYPPFSELYDEWNNWQLKKQAGSFTGTTDPNPVKVAAEAFDATRVGLQKDFDWVFNAWMRGSKHSPFLRLDETPLCVIYALLTWNPKISDDGTTLHQLLKKTKLVDDCDLEFARQSSEWYTGCCETGVPDDGMADEINPKRQKNTSTALRLIPPRAAHTMMYRVLSNRIAEGELDAPNGLENTSLRNACEWTAKQLRNSFGMDRDNNMWRCCGRISVDPGCISGQHSQREAAKPPTKLPSPPPNGARLEATLLSWKRGSQKFPAILKSVNDFVDARLTVAKFTGSNEHVACFLFWACVATTLHENRPPIPVFSDPSLISYREKEWPRNLLQEERAALTFASTWIKDYPLYAAVLANVDLKKVYQETGRR